jgi:hypothetical protein
VGVVGVERVLLQGQAEIQEQQILAVVEVELQTILLILIKEQVVMVVQA